MLAPLKVNVPVPALLNAPVPLITPLKVASLVVTNTRLSPASVMGPLRVTGAETVRTAILRSGPNGVVLVTRDMLKTMKPGSVIVDVAIDQGGCVETIHATSHENPTYKTNGVIHYAVPNMPALVGRTSTLGLTQATEPFVATLVQKGVERALAEHLGLAKGVNTRDGKIVYGAVAKALGYE